MKFLFKILFIILIFTGNGSSNSLYESIFYEVNFESSDIQGCEGKVIGTNVSQGAIMSTGDTLIFIIDDTEIIDDSEDDS